MMTSGASVQPHSSVRSVTAVGDLDRTVDWRRLVWAGHSVAITALCGMMFGAMLQAVSTVVSGRLAASPSGRQCRCWRYV
jgi:ATP-binding cassette, subfamily B, bacterial